MSHALAWLIAQIGRRGMVLAIIGTIWILYGLSLIVGDVQPQAASHVWHLSLDPVLRGSFWLGTGTLAVYTAASRPATDTPGFLAVTVCPMLYSFSYLIAWITWALPIDDPGYADGLFSALSWAAVITLIATVASWPEPTAGHGPPHLGPPHE